LVFSPDNASVALFCHAGRRETLIDLKLGGSTARDYMKRDGS
jgi:hypothetical protein